MKTMTTDRWRYRRKPYAEQREQDSGWSALAAAIVKQAVDDYRFAEERLQNPPTFSREGDRQSYIWRWKKEQYKIVKFFRSKWYATLCDIDPHLILRKLGAE